jgi:hypothetical protein
MGFDIKTLEAREDMFELIELLRDKDIGFDIETCDGLGEMPKGHEPDPFAEGARWLICSFSLIENGKKRAWALPLDHFESPCGVSSITKFDGNRWIGPAEKVELLERELASVSLVAASDEGLAPLFKRDETFIGRVRAQLTAAQLELAVRQSELEFRQEVIREILRNARRVIAHNMKFEKNWTRKWLNLILDENAHCSMVLHKAVDPHSAMGCKDIAQSRGYPDWESDLDEWLHNGGTFANCPLSILIPYNAIDSIATDDIFLEDEVQARKRGNVWRLYDKLTRLSMIEFANVEYRGFYVPDDALLAATEHFTKVHKDSSREFFTSEDVLRYLVQRVGVVVLNKPGYPYKFDHSLANADERFNVGSSPQLADFFFKFLGWPTVEMSEGTITVRDHELGVGDGQTTVFTLTGPRKRGKSFKEVPMDFTFDHKIVLELEGSKVNVPVALRVNARIKSQPLMVHKWEERNGIQVDIERTYDEALSRIPAGQCMVVRFLSEDNGNFYDAVVFRSPPHVGASVRATFYRQTPSCNAETFKDWLGRSNREPRFKIVRSCMAKRNARKMLSTYVRPRAEQRSSDNLNHPDFNVVGAITGRLSSGMHTVPWTGALKSMVASKKRIQGQCDWRKSKLLTRLYEKSLDDLQNAEDEKAYKDAQKKIILVERCNQGIIVVGDMAQIEIRVGASFSRDAALLQIFNDALLNPASPA